MADESTFIPTKAAKFRTSRFPGFVGGGTDPVTGNLKPNFLTLTPNPGEADMQPLTEAEDPPKPTVKFNGLRTIPQQSRSVSMSAADRTCA